MSSEIQIERITRVGCNNEVESFFGRHHCSISCEATSLGVSLFQITGENACYLLIPVLRYINQEIPTNHLCGFLHLLPKGVSFRYSPRGPSIIQITDAVVVHDCFEMSEAWHTAFGEYPNRLIGFVSQDGDILRDVLEGETWEELTEELSNHVTELDYKVIPYKLGFQI